MPKKKSVAVLEKKAVKKAIKKVAKVAALSKALVPVGQIHGKGGFFSDALESLGSMAGKALGSTFGPNAGLLGGKAGGYLGSKLAKIVGFGKYKVSKNHFLTEKADVFNFDEGNKEPSFEYCKDGSIIVTHREFLGTLNASSTLTTAGFTDFAGKLYRINPTDPRTFPWFHIIALMYQEWEPLGLMFQTKKLVGQTAANAAGAIVNNPGEVFAASIYDIDAGLVEMTTSPFLPFANQTDMENTEYTQDHASYEDFYHPLECDPELRLTKMLTCNSNNLSVSNAQQFGTKQTNTLAITQFASAFAPLASEPLQEIFLLYKIKLYKPLIKFAPPSKFLHMRADALASVLLATPLGLASSTTLPLINRIANGSTLIPTSLTTSTGSILNFQSDQFGVGEKYEFSLNIFGTAAAITAPVITLGTGLSLLSYYDCGTNSSKTAPNDSATTTSFLMKFAFIVTESINLVSTTTIKLGGAGVIPTAVTAMDFNIHPIRRIVAASPAY